MAQTGQVGGRTAVDSNATNRLTAPPEATTSPEADQAAGVVLPAQAIHRNATGLPPVPSVEEEFDGGAPNVQYLTGRVDSNRIGQGVKL